MNNDDLYFQNMLKEYKKQYFNAIRQDLISLFKLALEQNVYDIYDPKEYERTFMLKDSVIARINEKEETLYVFSDINTGYYSAVDGRDISPALQWFIQEGHSDSTGIDNEYHNYVGRHYLEKAQELIDQKYPDMKIKIINDKPPIV